MKTDAIWTKRTIMEKKEQASSHQYLSLRRYSRKQVTATATVEQTTEVTARESGGGVQ